MCAWVCFSALNLYLNNCVCVCVCAYVCAYVCVCVCVCVCARVVNLEFRSEGSIAIHRPRRAAPGNVSLRKTSLRGQHDTMNANVHVWGGLLFFLIFRSILDSLQLDCGFGIPKIFAQCGGSLFRHTKY